MDLMAAKQNLSVRRGRNLALPPLTGARLCGRPAAAPWERTCGAWFSGLGMNRVAAAGPAFAGHSRAPVQSRARSQVRRLIHTTGLQC